MSYFTKKQLITMLGLQAKANSAMSDAWLTSTNNEIRYYRAAFVEAAEAIDHLGFKWWKKTPPNIEQAILELVDAFHFSMGEDIRSYCKLTDNLPLDEIIEITAEHIVDLSAFNDEKSIKISEFNKEIAISALEKFIEQVLAEKYVSTADVIRLFEVFDVDSAKIYNMYVGKNTLNLFRTSNGQRENKYIKVWEGQEDNVYLEKYFDELDEGDAVDIEHLNNHLTTMYAFVLKNQASA